jgi:hypothetical protein
MNRAQGRAHFFLKILFNAPAIYSYTLNTIVIVGVPYWFGYQRSRLW